MKNLEEKDLIRLVEEAKTHFKDKKTDELFFLYGLSHEIIINFLGVAWLKAIQSKSESNKLNKIFAKLFRLNAPDESPDRYRHQHKIIDLAQLLYNLQNVKGFEEKISKFPIGELESSIAELECAEALTRSGSSVEFIVPKGKKGDDFDIKINVNETLFINCEVETKVESTSLSQNAVTNKLKKARTQLPPSQPGMIFLKIPETWVTNPSITAAMDTAIANSFSGTNRLTSVIVRWEQWHKTIGSNGYACLKMYKPYFNRNSILLTNEIETPLARIHKYQQNKWIYLKDIVGKNLKD